MDGNAALTRFEVNLPSEDVAFLPGGVGRVELEVEGRSAEDLVIDIVLARSTG